VSLSWLGIVVIETKGQNVKIKPPNLSTLCVYGLLSNLYTFQILKIVLLNYTDYLVIMAHFRS